MLPEKIYNLPSERGALLFFEPKHINLLQRQLDGERMLAIDPDDVTHFMRGISTDGILPTKGGRFQKKEDLAPFALSGVPIIKEKAIQSGEYSVLFVGGGFGAGSAREHAPRALKGAGVDVVVVVGGRAEKIFEENCLFAGGPLLLHVESDADKLNRMLQRINNNKELSYLEPYHDTIRPLIRESGGLPSFTKKRLENNIVLPIISHKELPSNHPMTAAEKIIASKMRNIDPDHQVVIPGDVGFIQTDFRFTYEFMTKMITDMVTSDFGHIDQVVSDKKSIALFEDHLVWSPDNRFIPLINSQREIASQYGLSIYKQKDSLPGSQGICHTLIMENALLLPGQVGIGTDSHTCSAGVLGSLAFGVGATAMANAFVTKDTLVEVPESVKVTFKGSLPESCTAKDVMLSVLADPYIKDEHAIGKVLEFGGEGLTNWSMDQLFVLTNMAVEGGAFTGIIPEPTPAVVDHLMNILQKSEEDVRGMFVQSDTGARYSKQIEIDLSMLEPMVATPGHPTNGKKISELEETKVTSAYIGSCTGGNLSDLQDVASVLSGRKTRIPLVVQAASMNIYEEAERMGFIDTIKNAGGEVLLPGCGACIGMGPGRIMNPDDTIISATNRNFPGRMGKPKINNEEVEGGNVYLASPRVVAESSLQGYIRPPEKMEIYTPNNKENYE